MTLLSIAGLYAWDDTIFDALHIPDGLDHDIAVAGILEECSELEVRITDPVTMKQSLDYWSMGMLPIWTRLYSTTQLDYNPIWNKDGTITETRNLGRSDMETRNLATSDAETRNLSSTADTTTTGQVSAFNSSTMQNADKQTMKGSGSDTGTINRTGSDTGTINRTGSDTGTVTRRETGNIGVTTTQQMLKEEREISQFNIYEVITRAFMDKYCIGVY
jgi:hypothetical protein